MGEFAVGQAVSRLEDPRLLKVAADNVGALPAVANTMVDALSVYGIRHSPRR